VMIFFIHSSIVFWNKNKKKREDCKYKNNNPG